MNLILFGGAFDPPHKGHLQMAYECHARFPAAKIIVLPTAESPTPGKEALTSMQHRLNMLHCQFRNCQKDGWLEISDLESQLPKPNYTIFALNYLVKHSKDFLQTPESKNRPSDKYGKDSLRTDSLRTENPAANSLTIDGRSEVILPKSERIGMMLGQDQWESFHQWHQPLKILEHCDLIVFSRAQSGGQKFFIEKPFGQSPLWISQDHYRIGSAHIFFINDKVCNAASREIRANIRSASSRNGVEYKELSTNWISGSVLDYIANHGLYRG